METSEFGHHYGEQVKCDGCGKWRRLKRGPVELFGNECWYPFENDTPEGMILITEDSIKCFDCQQEEIE